MQVARSVGIHIASAVECEIATQKTDFERRLREAIVTSTTCELAPSAAEADIVLLNQEWGTRNWHDIPEFGKYGFISEYSHKLLTICHDDVACVFLPGLYTSLTPNNHLEGWSVPCGYKRLYRNPPGELQAREGATRDRKWLFSFKGTNSSHMLRKRLTRLYEGQSDQYSFVVLNKAFHSHSEQDHEAYVREMLDSHFVLAPRGFSPSTYRLFEAMQHGRCPVVISDDWQPIEGIDWENCSLRVAERDIQGLREILTDRLPDAERLGRTAKREWQQNFSDGARERKMLNDLLILESNCQRPRDIGNLESFWRSRDFSRIHGWTLSQRIGKRVQRFWRGVYNDG